MSTNQAPQMSRDEVKAAREAKKLAKQKAKGAQSKGAAPEANQDVPQQHTSGDKISPKDNNKKKVDPKKVASVEPHDNPAAETITSIAEIAKQVEELTVKPPDSEKSKAELRAERRAKQEAQRASKVIKETKIDNKPKADTKTVVTVVDKEISPKTKVLEKSKSKSVMQSRVNWFQHLYKEQNEDPLSKVPLNCNLHPAIIKLGVQLATRVVSGGNARCIALIDALKKMVSDYSLPAKTEFSRGLEAHLSSSLEFLFSMRQPSASQTNAVKHFRKHLTQLPNNVDEFDAKKMLQLELDNYVREQICMAGEAISITVRRKIANGDTILTYGGSSIIERILREAWCAGVKFRAVIVGNRLQHSAKEMLRRLDAIGLPCTYVDITAISHVMDSSCLVLLGASALLMNGAGLGASGSACVALMAKRCNAPLLLVAETHKFIERVQTDAFVYNELGNPDDLITGDNSPLKDWRSNPNLSLLNLTYDVIPASLVTAVVTELAILPCTSAPVVLRFKF